MPVSTSQAAAKLVARNSTKPATTTSIVSSQPSSAGQRRFARAHS